MTNTINNINANQWFTGEDKKIIDTIRKGCKKHYKQVYDIDNKGVEVALFIGREDQTKGALISSSDKSRMMKPIKLQWIGNSLIGYEIVEL